MINIWCDASVRRVGITQLNRRGNRVCFAAFISDQGHYWTDVIYAKNSHEAEINAVMVALYWALEQGYNQINIYTDDESIIGGLGGRRRQLDDLVKLINNNVATIEISFIPRNQNRTADRLCRLAYKEYITAAKNKKRLKRKYSYFTVDSILRACERGYIAQVHYPALGFCIKKEG